MAILAPAALSAQLTVQPQTDLELLARTITGPGVQISAPQINCHGQGYGEFSYTGSLLGLEEGVLLTSGRINNAVGPNNAGDVSFQASTNGSSILNTVTGRTTYDACRFEFDIIPAGDSLEFDFVLGSEEYNEWVGSQYNDVFGFFIQGPGITGDPGIGSYHNIALIPGTDQPVTINNVNNGTNAAHYYNNPGGQHIQYDGLTRGLKAVARVQPCETYHLQLVVADASDRKYDSGVFIAKMKSNPVSMQLVTESGGNALIEGCNNGYVRFSRQSATPLPLTLQYFIQGTATNGVDYQAITPTPAALPKSITIPAGQTYVDRPIITVADGLDEGSEIIRFILGNPLCPSAAPMDTLDLLLVDTLVSTVTPVAPIICRGDSVQFHVVGGQQYQWSPATGLTTTTGAHPWARPTSTTTYALTITEGACSRTMHRTVRVSNLALSAAVTAPLCNGGSNGAINLSIAGGIAPYTYAWSGPGVSGASTQDLTGLAAGTYTVTVTDAACTRTQSFNVGQPSALGLSLQPSTLIYGQNIACHGSSDGAVTTTITGGTAPYSIAWTGPSGFTAQSASISGLAAGAYVVSIVDAHGCTTAGSVQLSASTQLQASITDLQGSACHGDGAGTATVTVSGGVPPYSYTWNTAPSQHGATATGLSPGAYTVQVSDQYGCAIPVQALITGPAQPLGLTLRSVTHVRCHGQASGSAQVLASGGTGPYTYAWSTTPVTASATVAGLTAGTYTATVTDGNGCTASLQVPINQPAQALAGGVVGTTPVLCHGASTGAGTVQGSGGVGPYAYTWNTVPVRYGATASSMPAGSYEVTIRDVEQCAVVVQVEITQPAAPLVLSIGAQAGPACHQGANGTATVVPTGGTGPYTYAWNTTPVQATATATGLSAGTHGVLVTDAVGCTRSIQVTLSAPAPISITGTVVPALCQGGANGSVDVSVSGGAGGFTYSWSGAGGYTATTQDVSGLASGGYTVTVEDANGCEATRTFQVAQPGLFSIDAILSDHNGYGVSCPNATDGSIDLQISGGAAPYTYAWSGPGGSVGSSQDLTGLPVGTYGVVVSDANGCGTGASYTLTAPSPMAATLDPVLHNGTAISCSGGSDGAVDAVVTGGVAPYTYAWSGPSFAASTSHVTGLRAGTYTLTVTDGNDCVVVQSITLSSPAPVVVSASGVDGVDCHGGSDGQATVNATGGAAPYTWAWATVPAQYAATGIGLGAGSHQVTATDANGCHGGLSVVVPGPAAPLSVGLASTTSVACHGASTGSATVLAAGGTAPYSYTWNTMPQQSGATASGLPAGVWTVSVVDAHGCSASRNVTITQPSSALSVSLISRTPVSCHGEDDGAAVILVHGGSGSWSVQWNTVPVRTGMSITGLPAGTWTATVSDNNGCGNTVQFPVVIGGPTAPLSVTAVPQAYPGGAHVSCPGAEDAQVLTTITGGTAPYDVVWAHPDGSTSVTEDPSGLGPGTHQVMVFDAHGCAAMTSITVSGPPAVLVTASMVSALCHGDDTGALDITVSGGVAPYGFAWEGPDGFVSSAADIGDLYAGVYRLIVTDGNGCKSLHVFDVTQPGTFQFDAQVSSFGPYNVSCADATDGSVQVDVLGGTLPYTYEWISVNGTHGSSNGISGMPAGTYHLVVTDANECRSAFSQALVAPSPLTLLLSAGSFSGGNQVACAGGGDGAIDATIGGGVPAYTPVWSGPNGFSATTADISSLQAGTYTLNVLDQNGCSIGSSITLQGPPAIEASLQVAAFAGGHGVSCAGATDGSIQLQLGGGVAPLLVSWTGPAGFTSQERNIHQLAAGAYTATITDANGCTRVVSTTLTAPAALSLSATTSDANGHGIACFGGATGSIDLTVSGGSGGRTFAWSGPGAFVAVAEDIADLSAGHYSVEIRDANGCTVSASFDLTQPDPIMMAAQIDAAACQGSNTGAIDLTTSGGVAPLAWQWSAAPVYSATTEDITGLYAAIYTVQVTDANGCSSSGAFDVGQPDLFQVQVQVGQYTGGFQVSCAGAQDGWMQAQVSGGTAPHTFHWTGPAGFHASTADVSGLAPGTYQLTIIDANGCSTVRNQSLVAPSPIAIGLTPSVYAGGANTGCSGSADGGIDAVVSGGVAPYAFAWTGPQGSFAMTEDISGLEAGSYTLQVTDAVGCVRTASITLIGPGGLSISAQAAVLGNGFELSCYGSADGSIDLTVQGGAAPLVVQWTGPDGFTSNAIDIDGLAAGLYAVLVTDANGCSVSAQVGLKAPPELVVTATSSLFSGGYQVSCFGASDGSIALSVNGGSAPYQVSWSGPAGFTASGTTLQDLAAGTYVASVTDDAGCTATMAMTLTSPSPLNITAALSDTGFGFQVGCSGNDGSVELAVLGGTPVYQFAWTGAGGYASQVEDPQDLTAGAYEVVITDANGCSVERSYSITAPLPLELAAIITSNECSDTDDGAVDLTVSGGVGPFIHGWNGPDLFTAGTEDLAGLASGLYTATVTDAMGCAASLEAAIIAADPIEWDVYMSQYGDVNIPCHGDSAGVLSVSITGGFQPLAIQWTGPDGYTSGNTMLTGLVAGTYGLSIIDGHGCTRDTSMTLIEPAEVLQVGHVLATYASGTHVSCHGANDGIIDITVMGGTAPYTFDWRDDSTGFSTAEDVFDLQAGNYQLVVTDARACQTTLGIILTEPDTALHLTHGIVDHHGADLSCADATDGGIGVAVHGGSPAYAITWTGPGGFFATADTLTGLSAGTYQLEVEDVNGCILAETFELIAPDPLLLIAQPHLWPSGTAISCHGADDGAIVLAHTGGTGAHAIAWAGPAGFDSTADTLAMLLPGTYCATVTDENGCLVDTCVDIVEPGAMSATHSVEDATCGLANGSVDVHVEGAQLPMIMEWVHGATTEDLEQVAMGSYSLLVTDVNGCTVAVEASVGGSAAVRVDHSMMTPLCHGDANGAIALDVLQGSAPFTVLWGDGSTDEDRGGLGAGIHAVTVTDSMGCIWQDDIDLVAPGPLTADTLVPLYANGHAVSTYGGRDGSIEVQPTGGTAPYHIVWEHGAEGSPITQLMAGTYTTTVTDANGCAITMSFILEGPKEVQVPSGFTPNGDGQNDLFVVRGIEGFPENQFVVYNRWGNVVYERLNYANDWRGENVQGEDLANGTYFIILRLKRTGTVFQHYVDLRR